MSLLCGWPGPAWWEGEENEETAAASAEEQTIETVWTMPLDFGALGLLGSISPYKTY